MANLKWLIYSFQIVKVIYVIISSHNTEKWEKSKVPWSPAEMFWNEKKKKKSGPGQAHVEVVWPWI